MTREEIHKLPYKAQLYINELERKLNLHVVVMPKGTVCGYTAVSQQRELFYNFITWYNAMPKVKKPENGLITTNIIDKYLKL